MDGPLSLWNPPALPLEKERRQKASKREEEGTKHRLILSGTLVDTTEEGETEEREKGLLRHYCTL